MPRVQSTKRQNQRHILQRLNNLAGYLKKKGMNQMKQAHEVKKAPDQREVQTQNHLKAPLQMQRPQPLRMILQLKKKERRGANHGRNVNVFKKVNMRTLPLKKKSKCEDSNESPDC